MNMTRLSWSIVVLCAAGVAALAAGGTDKETASSDAAPKFEEVEIRGMVVPYKAALKRLFGISLVGRWAEDQLALETDDGRLIPILPTDGGRFFYQDKAVQGRPMQVTARQYAKTPGLNIVKVRSIKDGKLQEIYYWCAICAIKMYQKQDCDCCQGPIELREHPVGERYQIPNRRSVPRSKKRKQP